MKKKGGLTDDTLSSSSAPPKRSRSSRAVSHVRTIPPLSPGESEDIVEKSSALELAPPGPF